MTMNRKEQARLARGIAELLGRFHPEANPVLRLQLAHWLARRIATGRPERFQPSIDQEQQGTAPLDYQI